MNSARNDIEARKEEISISQDKFKKDLQTSKSKLYWLICWDVYRSSAKTASETKVRTQATLKQQATIKIEEDAKEANQDMNDRIKEEQKDIEAKTKSNRENKQGEEFEVKDYNASPKLAVKSN